MAALLRVLAVWNRGLCLVTTRYTITDLEGYRQATTLDISLAVLNPEEGRALLRSLGVKGTKEELVATAQAMGGHALALTLLGTYIVRVHGGDIQQARRIAVVELDRPLDSFQELDRAEFVQRLAASLGVSPGMARVVDAADGSTFAVLEFDSPEAAGLFFAAIARRDVRLREFKKEWSVDAIRMGAELGEPESLTANPDVCPEPQNNKPVAITTASNADRISPAFSKPPVRELDTAIDAIATGDLVEAVRSLRSIAKFSKRELADRVLMQSGRLARTSREASEGRLSADANAVERMRIAEALLGLLRELETSFGQATKESGVSDAEVLAALYQLEAGIMKGSATEGRVEAINGINNLKSIAWLELGVRSSRSVCRILVLTNSGTGFGSGFLIAPGLVMTNNHVIGSAAVARHAAGRV